MAGIELKNEDYVVFESDNSFEYGSQFFITSHEENSKGKVIASIVTQSGDTYDLKLNSKPPEENNLIVLKCSAKSNNMFTIGAVPIGTLAKITENIEFNLINGSKL